MLPDQGSIERFNSEGNLNRSVFMGFVLFIHVSVCILLVTTILMQAGKGGGLAESFASAESMFGTQTNAFLVRTSSILAAIFLGTSLVLAVHGAKGDKSLMANQKLLPKTQQVPQKEEQEPKISVQVSQPKPVDAANVIVNAAK